MVTPDHAILLTARAVNDLPLNLMSGVSWFRIIFIVE